MVRLMVLFSLSLASPAAVACRCMQPPDVATAMMKSNAVFLATMASETHDGMSRVISFDVSQSFKGADSTPVVVRTSSHGASCGFLFKQGISYLIYAYENDDGQLFTTICSRTGRASDKGEDIKALQAAGVGVKPSQKPPAPKSEPVAVVQPAPPAEPPSAEPKGSDVDLADEAPDPELDENAGRRRCQSAPGSSYLFLWLLPLLWSRR